MNGNRRLRGTQKSILVQREFAIDGMDTHGRYKLQRANIALLAPWASTCFTKLALFYCRMPPEGDGFVSGYRWFLALLLWYVLYMLYGRDQCI